MYHPTTRVLTLLELLQSHGRLSGPDLARRLEVDARTVRRYITILQDLGIPIEVERGRYGSYGLRPGYKLPPLMLNEDEATAITLGLFAARHLPLAATAPAVEGALAKISRVLPTSVRNRVEALQQILIFAVPPADPPPAGDIVLTISTAVQQSRRVEMGYRAWDGAETVRAFDPYGLVYHEGRWYTVGYCHLREDLRVFRMDRIGHATPGDAAFQRPADFDSLAYILDSLASQPGNWSVEVLIQTSLAAAQERVSPTFARVETTADGVRLRCEARDLNWMARFLVSLGWPFVVQQPPELRTALRDLAEEILRCAEEAPAESVRDRVG